MRGVIAMTCGDKIKKIRELKGLSRKELANWCGISEYTLRSYEQGIRKPSAAQLEVFAAKLGVNINALSNPTNAQTLVAAAHILFDFEDELGFTVSQEDGFLCIRADELTINNFLLEWHNMKEKLEKGEITRVEYDMWRYNYPTSQAKIFQEQLRKTREKRSDNDDDSK